ncbi:hypothetical protein [Amycolatopsis sp. NPDC050768]|uniref:hypothetical protein n=1 Tax=Amycolatopsis sp. NPDC050768 TaxID=3154839 RepID=UPI0033C7034E
MIKELLGHAHIGVAADVYAHVRLRLQRQALYERRCPPRDLVGGTDVRPCCRQRCRHTPIQVLLRVSACIRNRQVEELIYGYSLGFHRSHLRWFSRSEDVDNLFLFVRPGEDCGKAATIHLLLHSGGKHVRSRSLAAKQEIFLP